MVKILAVCGMGLGSGLVIRMQVEKVLKEAKVPAKVEVADISSARGIGTAEFDIIMTSTELAPQLGTVKATVVTLHNLFDLNEIREKLLPVVQKKL
jgi:PTS system ascorbate-specific IIB component